MNQTWFHRMIGKVLEGQIPVLIIMLALIAGLVSLYITPREEEPQIIVPMADVLISALVWMPGRWNGRSQRPWKNCLPR